MYAFLAQAPHLGDRRDLVWTHAAEYCIQSPAKLDPIELRDKRALGCGLIHCDRSWPGRQVARFGFKIKRVLTHSIAFLPKAIAKQSLGSRHSLPIDPGWQISSIWFERVDLFHSHSKGFERELAPGFDHVGLWQRTTMPAVQPPNLVQETSEYVTEVPVDDLVPGQFLLRSQKFEDRAPSIVSHAVAPIVFEISKMC